MANLSKTINHSIKPICRRKETDRNLLSGIVSPAVPSNLNCIVRCSTLLRIGKSVTYLVNNDQQVVEMLSKTEPLAIVPAPKN